MLHSDEIGVVRPGFLAKADLDIIVKSAKELVKLTDDEGYKSVVLPRPGCGAGELKWEDVKPHLEEIFDDRFFIITYEEGVCPDLNDYIPG